MHTSICFKKCDYSTLNVISTLQVQYFVFLFWKYILYIPQSRLLSSKPQIILEAFKLTSLSLNICSMLQCSQTTVVCSHFVRWTSNSWRITWMSQPLLLQFKTKNGHLGLCSWNKYYNTCIKYLYCSWYLIEQIIFWKTSLFQMIYIYTLFVIKYIGQFTIYVVLIIEQFQSYKILIVTNTILKWSVLCT